MLDTNVLISMILFPGKRFTQMLEFITRHHGLVLSSFVVDELMAVADRKFPSKRYTIDRYYNVESIENCGQSPQVQMSASEPRENQPQFFTDILLLQPIYKADILYVSRS